MAITQGIKKFGKGVQVLLSDDDTEAYIKLIDMNVDYKLNDIVSILKESGITHNIDSEAINEYISKKILNEVLLVAKNKEPVAGKDGWYEFCFDINVDNKPKVLRDGSVDYAEYGNVPAVEEGDVIAIYHPATKNDDGISIRGDVLAAPVGKDLAKLNGKGFTVSEDGHNYIATSSGKASYKDGRLLVEKELLIEGDVSNITGTVTFVNDIHIRGSVLTGIAVISTKGNVIVDGYVEGCEIFAGKDVVLKNGMQGNGKGKITAGGSVKGKFFEQVVINAKGSVDANAILNSTIFAKDDIVVSGRFGIIIGGTVYSEKSISATIIGNMTEVKTLVKVGADGDLIGKLAQLDKKVSTLQSELQKVLKGIEQIELLMKKSDRKDLNDYKVNLIRAKVEKDMKIKEVVQEKQEIMKQIAKSDLAKVSVQKTVYPGTTLRINGIAMFISEEMNHAEFIAQGSIIEVRN